MSVFKRKPDPEQESTTRAAVTVTFLRQDFPPRGPSPSLATDMTLIRLARPSVAFYRYLYATVGDPYLWWLRRTMTDQQIADIVQAPGVSIHVLYRGGEPHGFFELDARAVRTVNLSYFGLMPQAVGQGMGMPFLRAALDAAWAQRPGAITVNTCTADHRRALPTYLACGFVVTRRSLEMWDVPDRLGLMVPQHLRA